MQVSRLVRKMKEESKGDTESVVKKRLLEKVAALTQSRLPRVADVLAMIWNGVVEPPDLPTPEPKSTPFTKTTLFSNWHRVRLALLKSIPTGTFIDVQLFAYNALSHDLPVDLRPLYISSIVIERWGTAITTGKSESSSKLARPQDVTEESAGIDSQPACLLDGLTDDYEYWLGDLPEEHHGGEMLYVPDLQNSQVESTLRPAQEVPD